MQRQIEKFPVSECVSRFSFLLPLFATPKAIECFYLLKIEKVLLCARDPVCVFDGRPRLQHPESTYNKPNRSQTVGYVLCVTIVSTVRIITINSYYSADCRLFDIELRLTPAGLRGEFITFLFFLNDNCDGK